MSSAHRPDRTRGATFGRDPALNRGLSARDVLAFGEAWRRGSRSQPLATYLGGIRRASEGSRRFPSQPG